MKVVTPVEQGTVAFLGLGLCCAQELQASIHSPLHEVATLLKSSCVLEGSIVHLPVLPAASAVACRTARSADAKAAPQASRTRLSAYTFNVILFNLPAGTAVAPQAIWPLTRGV